MSWKCRDGSPGGHAGSASRHDYLQRNEAMKRARRMAAAVLVGAAAVAGVGAPMASANVAERGAGWQSDGRNAALYYWRAFYSVDREFQRQSGELLQSPRSATWAPDASTVAKLEANRGFINQLLTATRIERCDFDIAYEEGLMALIPHLGLMRSGARILVLDERRLLAEGKMDDAAERIAAIYRMSVHLRNDNVLISSLVSMALAGLAADEAQVLAESGKLTETGRDAIVAALQPLNTVDGFGAKRCIEMERRITVDYLRGMLTGPEAGKKLSEADLIQIPEELKKQIFELDEAGVGADLDLLNGYYTGVLRAWDDPAHAAEFAALEKKVESGEFGLIAKVLAPAMSKAKTADIKGADRVREVLQVLASASIAGAETETATK